MISYDKTDYLYVFIPSVCSLVCCFLLILSVAVQPPLRDRIYHRLSVALASTQIIMYSSWMLGNRYVIMQIVVTCIYPALVAL